MARKKEVVAEELAGLADRVLNGELEETVDGEKTTLTEDRPERAAFYATQRTLVYDEEPAAVIDYTEEIPDNWRDYVTDERTEIQALAKASFQYELQQYLEGYAEGDA